jgi:hypothetical protein
MTSLQDASPTVDWSAGTHEQEGSIDLNQKRAPGASYVLSGEETNHTAISLSRGLRCRAYWIRTIDVPSE